MFAMPSQPPQSLDSSDDGQAEQFACWVIERLAEAMRMSILLGCLTSQIPMIQGIGRKHMAAVGPIASSAEAGN